MKGRVSWRILLAGVVLVGTFVLNGSALAAWGQGGLNLVLGLPQNEFKENVNRPGFGLALQFEGGPGHAAVGFGLSGGFMIYGSETRHEPFSMTIPDVTVKVQTTNNLAFGHVYVKAMPRRGEVRPYVMGLVGLHYLFTQTRIQSENDPDNEVASSTNFSDTALSYGFAVGLQVKVAEKITESKKTGKKQRVVTFVDVRLSNLRGGEAEYLKEGSIRRENGRVIYDVSRSSTDLMLIQAGITVGF